MSDIVTERRKSIPKIEFEERRRILFHIESLQGLPQHGWQPIPSTFVAVEGLESRDTLVTECRKSGPVILWGENMPIQDLKDSSEVRFDIKSKGLWKNKALIGKTDTFEIRQLMKMQNEVGQDRDSFISLVVNMNAPISSEKSHTVTLSLSIREMPAPNRNLELTVDDVQRLVEECQQQCFTELGLLDETMNILRKTTFAEELSLLCLLDLLQGTTEGIRKVIANPETRNTNKLTVACCKALSGAFAPYQSLSARKLGKKGEKYTAIVKDMLCSAIQALQSVERVLRIQSNYHYEKHHLEQKQVAWTRYFEFCEQFLMDGGTDQELSPPRNTAIRRLQCPYYMVANPALPFGSKVVPMDLPITYASSAYDHPDLVRLVGQWIFSRSFSSRGISDVTPSQKPRKVFCLSGPPGCGKTQLASHIMYWLREMNCLGGYFSFDRVTAQSPSELLEALPITMIHQVCTIQPEIAQKIGRMYQPNLQAVQSNREAFFDKAFVQPILKFEEERGSRSWRLWNPADPLVFVIDGFGSPILDGKQSQNNGQMLQDLAQLFASPAIGNLPSYLKFLILCRSDTGLDKLFCDREISYVHEMMPAVQYAESVSSCTARNGYGSSATSGNGRDLSSTVPSISIERF